MEVPEVHIGEGQEGGHPVDPAADPRHGRRLIQGNVSTYSSEIWDVKDQNIIKICKMCKRVAKLACDL